MTEVNPETDCIALTDWDDEIWIFESENFKAGQLVIISFDNSGTDTIFDDKIIEVKG